MFKKIYTIVIDKIFVIIGIPGLRRFGLSLFFGILVVLLYYALEFFVPSELALHNEIVTILFILISVILLFPARESILNKILTKYDYLVYFGHDPHHLELLARHFSIDSLKSRMFREFMQWLGSQSALMAILSSSRDHYNYYFYKNGKTFEQKPQSNHEVVPELILRHLKNKRIPIDVLDTSLDHKLLESMNKIGALLIHPFIYRKSITGFIIFFSQPKHKYTGRALDFFGHMAAVSIQNFILSSRVINSQEYDLELQSAKRIQKVFSKTNVPKIKGFRISPRGVTRTVIEFFKTQSGSFFLVALSVTKLTGATGILLYGMLGSLHALLHREPGISINKLMNYLKDNQSSSQNEYHIHILIAEITAKNAEITILHEGDHYSFCDTMMPKKNLLSLGWRNLIELDRKKEYILSYQSVPLLSIEHYKDENQEREYNGETSP